MLTDIGSNGAVLVTEKKSTSPLIDDSTIERIAEVCPGTGIVYSGMGPDARILLLRARKQAVAYRHQYGEYPPALQVVKELAKVMQEYTQSGGVRPFGVSVLVIGKAAVGDQYELYQVDPSGAYWGWKGTAIGRGSQSARAFLEKRYASANASDEETGGLFEVEDAVHLGLLSLKEGFEGQMTADNVQVGVARKNEFKILTPSELSDYLQNL